MAAGDVDFERRMFLSSHKAFEHIARDLTCGATFSTRLRDDCARLQYR